MLQVLESWLICNSCNSFLKLWGTKHLGREPGPAFKKAIQSMHGSTWESTNIAISNSNILFP